MNRFDRTGVIAALAEELATRIANNTELAEEVAVERYSAMTDDDLRGVAVETLDDSELVELGVVERKTPTKRDFTRVPGILEALDFIQKIALSECWDETENGLDGEDSVSREFQEFAENERQDWIIEARRLCGIKET